jgi:hypothetical protein
MLRNKLSLTLSLCLVLCLLAFIMPVTRVTAAIEIDLDPASGKVGDEVEVLVTNWEAGAYNLFFGTTKVISNINSDANKHFTVPKCPSGEYPVILKSGATSIAETVFTVEPEINISPRTAQVGDKITITGTGFLDSDSGTIALDGKTLKEFSTDSYGSFTTTFIMPDSAFDTYTVTAQDDKNSASIEIGITPKVTLSSNDTSAGEKISVSGSGFSAASNITMKLDNQNLNASVTTNSNGGFSNKQITIPIVNAGSHTLLVEDSQDHSFEVTLNTSQSINLSPRSGPANTDVQISGAGFTPNKNVTITYKGIPVATTPLLITADSGGNFSAVFKTPSYAAGVYPVIVSQGSLISSANFTQTSTVNIDKTTGAIGSTVTASGNGFNSSTKITLKYDGSELTSVTTDTLGSFYVSFKVPVGPAGQHKLIITDNINSFPLIFTASASAFLDSSTGNVGSEINVTGNAFNPGSAVTVKFDSIEAATATADSVGSFSVALKTPASKGGPHNITVSDGNTSSIISFNIETTPPTIPVPTLPVNGDKGDSLAKFQWNPVSDPSSPVSYTLQLAQDSSFSSMILEKVNLTTNNYQLTEFQKLKATGQDKPYYWRVKAIDSAGNESNWSNIQRFSVGAILPGWLLIVIYAASGLFLLLVGFFLGRKLKFNINIKLPSFKKTAKEE